MRFCPDGVSYGTENQTQEMHKLRLDYTVLTVCLYMSQ